MIQGKDAKNQNIELITSGMLIQTMINSLLINNNKRTKAITEIHEETKNEDRIDHNLENELDLES